MDIERAIRKEIRTRYRGKPTRLHNGRDNIKSRKGKKITSINPTTIVVNRASKTEIMKEENHVEITFVAGSRTK